jgi:hypothetical protein
MERQLSNLLTLAIITLVMGPFVASAQFHTQQTPAAGGARAGRAIVNQNAVTAVQHQGSLMDPNAAMALSGGDTILTDQQRQKFAQVNPRLKQMHGRVADVWGRGIHHKDGSITESKQDTNTKTLEQITKKNNVALQRRMIMLDQYGRPTEVMIYDGRGTFKYRGVQVYDTFGRFAEEQIYNPNGDLIRRKVQGYTPQGAKMPVRSWDYIDNVPADLRLVITRESESSTDPVGRANANQTKPQEEKRNWFNGNKNNSTPNQPAPDTAEMQPQPLATQQPSYNAAATVPEKRKGLNLGRLFGRKK